VDRRGAVTSDARELNRRLAAQFASDAAQDAGEGDANGDAAIAFAAAARSSVAIAMANGSGLVAAQRELLATRRRLRSSTCRIVIEYGGTATPAATPGRKTSFVTTVRAAHVEQPRGHASPLDMLGGLQSNLIDRVDFNINPGFAKPTATVRQAHSSSYTFEYTMARPFPCIVTVHWHAALQLAPLQLNYCVTLEAELLRRVVVELPKMAHRSSTRKLPPVVFDADPPRNGWVHYHASTPRLVYLGPMGQPSGRDAVAVAA